MKKFSHHCWNWFKRPALLLANTTIRRRKINPIPHTYSFFYLLLVHASKDTKSLGFCTYVCSICRPWPPKCLRVNATHHLIIIFQFFLPVSLVYRVYTSSRSIYLPALIDGFFAELLLLPSLLLTHTAQIDLLYSL